MTTLFTDAITRADASTLGADYVQLKGEPGRLGVVSNQIDVGTAATDCGDAIDAGISWPSDHWIEADCVLVASGEWLLWVRGEAVSGSTKNGYQVGCDNGNEGDNLNVILKRVADAWTELVHSATQDVTAGVRARGECLGTSIRLKVGGAVKASTTDVSFSSGKPGLSAIHSAGNVALFDNIEAGDFVDLPNTGFGGGGFAAWGEVPWGAIEEVSAEGEITGAGNIASAEAFGTTIVDRPHVDPSGIASAEAFGTAALDLTLNPSAIASAEAFGTAALDLTLNPSGIASAEAFGTASLDLTVNPGSIASVEAFGTAKLDLHLDPGAIASAEAFGTATVEVQGATLNIDPSGIASAEAFGSTIVDRPHVDPLGIASAQAFGTASIDLTLNPSGIPSAQAFGTALIDQPIITPSGIASAQAFGTAKLDLHVNPGGIATAEAFGVAKLDLTVNVTGIASAQAFGTVIVERLGADELLVTGIVSGETFGAALVGVLTEQEIVMAMPHLVRNITTVARSTIVYRDVRVILAFEPEEV